MKDRFLAFSFFILCSSTASAQEQITIEQVIKLALERNYDILLAKNTSESAATDDRYSVGVFLPQVNANGALIRTNNHQEFEFADESRNVSGDAQRKDLTGSAQAVWTLFDGTKMFVTRERLAEIAAQGETNVKNQMVNTIASVIINYYGVVRQKQQLTAILEQKSISEERVKLAEKKLQVGTGGKPELLQAKVDLNSIRTLEIQQETTITQLKEQLNGLVGLALPSGYDVTDTIIIDLSLKQSEIEQDIENKNFSLIAAKQSMSIAGLSLRERRAERIPVVNLNAAYNYSRIDNIQLINPFSSLINQSNGYNYGLSLSIPILNGFTITRSIQQARINEDRQRISYELQKLQVDIGVRNAFINYENAIKVLVLEEENILLAKENLNIALEGFKRGVTTFIELRTAQQSLAEAYNRLINARYISKLAETELLRLNGSLLR